MWLKIKEGETISAAIDLASVKTVAKHWTGQRSELCLGAGCPHCLASIPKRWRYQAKLIIDREPIDWEFGEQAMIELNNISHNTNLAHVSITRLGQGRDTRYRITTQTPTEEPATEQSEAYLPIVNKYTRGKYGHLVQY